MNPIIVYMLRTVMPKLKNANHVYNFFLSSKFKNRLTKKFGLP